MRWTYPALILRHAADCQRRATLYVLRLADVPGLDLFQEQEAVLETAIGRD